MSCNPEINESLEVFEKSLVSKDPVVIAADAQITFSSSPDYNRKDIPLDILYKQEDNDFEQIKTLQKHIDTTKSLIPFLYSYRSVSRAIYNPDNHIKEAENDEKNREIIMKLFVSLFQPCFEKMCLLRDSLEEASKFVGSSIISMKNLPSNMFFQKLVELFEVILNLEQMKMVKVGLTNDLSLYRRQKVTSDPEKEKNILLPQFLATPLHTLTFLKNYFSNDKGTNVVKIFSKFVDYCISQYSKSIIAKQKQSYVISILSTLVIIGKKKLITKENSIPIFNIINENTLIPLIGENHFEVASIFDYIDGFSPPKGISLLTDKEKLKAASDKFLIKNKIQHFRDLYKQMLPLIYNIIMRKKVDSLETLYNILSCISEMTSSIMTQFAYKSNCHATSSNPETSLYDCQVRLNYSPIDLSVLIELIGQIKTIAGFALQAEPIIMSFVYEQIGNYIQNFVQITLGEVLSCASKKDDKETEKYISALRNIFGKSINEKKFKPDPSNIPPSINQLEILREQIYILTQPPSPLFDKKGKLKGAYKQKFIDDFNAFLDETSNFYLLMDYSQYVHDSSNLGSLWFRETALDIESKIHNIIQFPVRSSLPFILAEHVLSATNEPSLHDCVFFPFEIYNDAAYLAINVFKSQYLYKEIEAEVSLCVDMISFTFAQAFFKCCRESAAGHELPSCVSFKPKPIRYETMVKQHKLQLLGSPVDFNLITTYKLNETLEKELHKYISLLSDLRATPFIAHLIRVCKTTHYFLKKNGLLLDDFSTLWSYARLSQPDIPYTALSTALIDCIDPSHLVFNVALLKFFPTKDLMLIPPNKEDWALTYVQLHSKDVKYLGLEHCEAIIEILDEGELASFIANIFGRIDQEISKFITLYLEIAKFLRITTFDDDNDLSNFFLFICDAYNGLKHPQMGQLFNILRNIGNLVALLYLIECEFKAKVGKSSIIGNLVSIFKLHIEQNKSLFISQDFDPFNLISHRTFPALWSILEFLLCSPHPVQLSENMMIPHPIETFGDGVVIAANMFILLSGEKSLYQYDSVSLKALRLFDISKGVSAKDDLPQFIYYASISNQARTFTEILINPFI